MAGTASGLAIGRCPRSNVYTTHTSKARESALGPNQSFVVGKGRTASKTLQVASDPLFEVEFFKGGVFER